MLWEIKMGVVVGRSNAKLTLGKRKQTYNLN